MKIFNDSKIKIILIIIVTILFIIGFNVIFQKKTQLLNNQALKKSTITDVLPNSHRDEPPIVDFKSKGQQDNNYYFKLLKNRIVSEHLSAQTWFTDKCNQFWLMDKETQFQIERHERHIEGCGDADPNTAPLLDMFTIDKRTEEIFRLDNTKGQNATFNEWAKTVSKE